MQSTGFAAGRPSHHVYWHVAMQGARALLLQVRLVRYVYGVRAGSEGRVRASMLNAGSVAAKMGAGFAAERPSHRKPPLISNSRAFVMQGTRAVLKATAKCGWTARHVKRERVI